MAAFSMTSSMLTPSRAATRAFILASSGLTPAASRTALRFSSVISFFAAWRSRLA
jgi:hypothetical protein